MKIRQRICTLTLGVMSLTAYAQNTQQINVSPYIDETSEIPASVEKVVYGKLGSIITSCGFGNVANQRFVLVPKASVVTEDVTETAPTMYAYTLNINLCIGDGVTGTLFSSKNVQVKGVGTSKGKAYMQAFNTLNGRDAELKAFVEKAKEKILQYYQLNGASILQHAKTLAGKQEFDAAIDELSSIPSACEPLYTQANQLMLSFYNKMLAQEGDKMLAQATAIWNASQDADAAERAGELLSQINPQSPAYAKAKVLFASIKKRISALDAREWKYKLQEQRNEHALNQARIAAARAIGTAWAKNRPRIVYHVHNWW